MIELLETFYSGDTNNSTKYEDLSMLIWYITLSIIILLSVLFFMYIIINVLRDN